MEVFILPPNITYIAEDSNGAIYGYSAKPEFDRDEAEWIGTGATLLGSREELTIPPIIQIIPGLPYEDIIKQTFKDVILSPTFFKQC